VQIDQKNAELLGDFQAKVLPLVEEMRKEKGLWIIFALGEELQHRGGARRASISPAKSSSASTPQSNRFDGLTIGGLMIDRLVKGFIAFTICQVVNSSIRQFLLLFRGHMRILPALERLSYRYPQFSSTPSRCSSRAAASWR
jgi:hypothetical protein